MREGEEQEEQGEMARVSNGGQSEWERKKEDLEVREEAIEGGPQDDNQEKETPEREWHGGGGSHWSGSWWNWWRWWEMVGVIRIHVLAVGRSWR